MGKNATKDEVKQVANDLISMNGNTTTLDVKTELRKRGFDAVQKDVSKHLATIADEETWTVTIDSDHKVYTNKTNANKWWNNDGGDSDDNTQ